MNARCCLAHLGLGIILAALRTYAGEPRKLPDVIANDIQIIWFSASEFRMGCPDHPPEPWSAYAHQEARPEHLVKLRAFGISKYPITVAQYCQFLNSSAHGLAPDEGVAKSSRFSDITSSTDHKYLPKAGKDRQPIREISFSMAIAFCSWLSQQSTFTCRLPSEAEWEFVAKGTTGRTYPWGERAVTHNPIYDPIGSHPELATPEGVHDLNGSVYQWCIDRYNPGFYRDTLTNNPICESGRARVVRGGPMFRYAGRLTMPATWKRFQGSETDALTGFRIVIETDCNQ